MGCGCGKKKKISVNAKQNKAFTNPNWQKCPSCGSKLISIHKYNKGTKKMMAVTKCSNNSCTYVK